MEKLKKQIAENVKNVLANRSSSLVNDGAKKIGQTYKVIGDLQVFTMELDEIDEATGKKKVREYVAWPCEGNNARGTQNVLSPVALAAFTSNKQLTEWTGDVNGAFIAKGTDDEAVINEMIDFINACNGAVKICGKARHPRFNQWIYAYDKA